MRTILVGSLVILCSQVVLAQRATYFNYDMGFGFHRQTATSTIFEVEGATLDGNIVKPMKWREWMWAVSIEQEITKHLSVQAGLRV